MATIELRTGAPPAVGEEASGTLLGTWTWPDRSRRRRTKKGQRAKSGRWWERRPTHPIRFTRVFVDGGRITKDRFESFFDRPSAL